MVYGVSPENFPGFIPDYPGFIPDYPGLSRIIPDLSRIIPDLSRIYPGKINPEKTRILNMWNRLFISLSPNYPIIVPEQSRMRIDMCLM